MELYGESIFNIKSFGAVSDMNKPSTAAIQKAIDECGRNGGGTVYCPPGDYLTSSLILRSNVTIHLSSGCTLWANPDTKDAILPFSGNTYLRCLLFASDCENIIITGGGRIHGQGEKFWTKGEKKSEETPYHYYDERSGWGDNAQHWWYPSEDRYGQMLAFYHCRNCRIENVSLLSAPAWCLMMHDCDYMTVRGVTIQCPMHGPNTDGIDIDACQRVIISDCNIQTGDDAIVLKSIGMNGVTRKCRDITVTNCILSTPCNGFKLGTESVGGFENITFSNSVISCEADDPKFQSLGGVVIESTDGAHNNNIAVSNISMMNVRAPIFVFLGGRGRNPLLKGPEPGKEKENSEFIPGSIRNLSFNNITAYGATITSSITGMPGYDVEGVSLNAIHIEYCGGESEELAYRPVPERPKAYPETTVYGKGAAGGLYCRHVKDIRLSHMRFRSIKPDGRPVLFFDDVKGIDLCGIKADAPSSGLPVVLTSGCSDISMYGCRPDITIKET